MRKDERDTVIQALDGNDYLTNTSDLEYYKVYNKCKYFMSLWLFNSKMLDVLLYSYLIHTQCMMVVIIFTFSQVPFTEALDLVRGRKVLLKQGYAFVPQHDLVSILLSVFRSQLSQALTVY